MRSRRNSPTRIGDTGRQSSARRLAALLLSGIVLVGAWPDVGDAQTPPMTRTDLAVRFAAHIDDASRRFRVPAAWIRLVMGAESAGDVRAVSRAGAMGLMQIMPDTWPELQARYRLGSNPFDPHDNILAGTAYLRELYDRYGSPGFLAAYNAGPRRYEEYLAGVRTLPAETRAYVALLAPLIGGNPREDATAIVPDPLAWTRSPLFVVRSNGSANAEPSQEQRGLGANSTTARARDATSLSPRSSSLFVAQASPDPQQ